jgi:DNA-binding helix-hairpin-helix protein with protein kinase domain
MHQTRITSQWSSTLLDRQDAAERWAADKKPMVGLLLWQGELDGKEVVVRFVGYEKRAEGFVIEHTGRFAK